MKRGASTQLNKKNSKSGILSDSLSDDEFFSEGIPENFSRKHQR